MGKEYDKMCPKCKKFLVHTVKDGKEHRMACKNCEKWIWWGNNYTEIHDIPQRTSSSGKRFY